MALIAYGCAMAKAIGLRDSERANKIAPVQVVLFTRRDCSKFEIQKFRKDRAPINFGPK
jgi:hypothetical protein